MKPRYKKPGEGLQQAREYAEILGLKFAYATNGEGIVEFDFITGLEEELVAFPPPKELWSRYCLAQKISDEPTRKRLLTPCYHTPGKTPRYYQEIAINWREILEYFQPAYQLGMTATPLRDDNRDTYAYFGDPIYTYSLRQGIEDGFLA